jgi:hypothetical protein
MNALQICGISVISMEIESSAGIYSHADLADLADFLFSSPLGPFPEQNGK